MSCPIVAGIIAQWMEAIPTLTREQIVEAFNATCHRYDPLLAYPNNDYGYGEIDAEAGLEYLLDNVTAIPQPAVGEELSSFPLGQGRAGGGPFNLLGQRVSKDYKGIVVTGGRKELRK